MLNRSILIGRLVRDPELRFTQNGIARCTFTLAVDRRYKNAAGEKEADFIDITTWRALAENCGNYLQKGSQVAVEGCIQTGNYETAAGEKRKSFGVLADSVKFLTGPRKEQPEQAAVNYQEEIAGEREAAWPP